MLSACSVPHLPSLQAQGRPSNSPYKSSCRTVVVQAMPTEILLPRPARTCPKAGTGRAGSFQRSWRAEARAPPCRSDGAWSRATRSQRRDEAAANICSRAGDNRMLRNLGK